jgi:hypothetical protein
MVPQMLEAARAYQLDGFWVDGECLGAGLDYSPAAKAAWQAATGSASPPTDASQSSWFAWKQFNRTQFLKHLNTWVDGVHQGYPTAQVASNWTFTAYAPEAVQAKVDFLSGDFSYLDGVNTPRYQARFMSSLGVPWDLMAWGFIHAGPTNYYVLPPEAVEQEAAAVIMQGGAVQVYHHPGVGGVIPEDIIKQTGEISAFCRARKTESFKSTSVPQVALLLSAQTYFDKAQTAFAWRAQWAELEGILHGLLEGHYSVDVMSENQLKPRLAQFSLVVVPNSYRLNDDFLAALQTYVTNGGNLLVVGAKCTSTLAQLEGVTANGPPIVVPGFVPTSTGGLASASGYWQPVTPLAGTQVFAQRYLAADHSTDGNTVASTLRTLGTGKVLGMYGPFAIDYYNRDEDVQLRQWLLDSVKTLFPNPAVMMNGPDVVDLSFRRTSNGKFCVHLLNHSPVPGNPPSHVAKVPPVGPMTLFVKLAKRPAGVRWIPGNEALPSSWENGTLRVNIGKLAIHGVVVIE